MTEFELSAQWMSVDGEVFLIDRGLGVKLMQSIPPTEGELPLLRSSLAWEIINRVRQFGPLVVDDHGQFENGVKKYYSLESK